MHVLLWSWQLVWLLYRPTSFLNFLLMSPIHRKRTSTMLDSLTLIVFAGRFTTDSVILFTISTGYQFFEKNSFNISSSSSSVSLEQILMALLTRDRTRFVLCSVGQKESHLVYKPVKVGFRYTDLTSFSFLVTRTSINGRLLSLSFSMVNFRQGCKLLSVLKKG